VYQPRALGKAIADPELGINFKRALHGEQDMRFCGPIRPGDEISTSARIEDIRDKGTGETISIELVSKNQNDELVETTLFTLFVRGERRGSASAGSTGAATPRDEPLHRVSQQLDPDQTFRYAEASGDRTRIHLDDEAARSAGLPGIIGHGLCTMGFVSKVLVDHLASGDPGRLARMSLRFAEPVFPGQAIETLVWAAGVEGANQTFAFETLNPDGQRVISQGIAEIRPETT
jgi:acyl dehydratase